MILDKRTKGASIKPERGVLGEYRNMIAWQFQFNADVSVLNYELPSGWSPIRSVVLAE